MTKEFFCTKTAPAVETTAGKVRGYRYDGIYNFMGIPYGTAKRFRAPEPVAPWEGYRDTTVPGFNCPSIGHSQAVDCFPHNFWLESEDCLNLNVWTPSLEEGARKPVVVWLHGGGFAYGSPLRQPAYEGSALAQFGDVVLVSITSRLNIFGFLDLSAYGEEYKNSGNNGVADLVLAMKWIRNNIARFGGDPENVTICGQSGGGGKVVALLQCPEADGTFRKAIIMSGVGFKSLLSIGTAEVPKAMLEALGKPQDDLTPLEQLSTADLVRLYKSVLPGLKQRGINVSFGPVANDYFDGLPSEQMPGFTFSRHAKDIPVVIGSTFTEMNLCAALPDKYSMTEAEMLEVLRERYGEDTEMLVELFRRSYPDKKILDLGYLDGMVRKATYDFLDERVRTCKAPTYVYIFTPEIQYNGGIPAWHSSDMAYLFHNVAITPVANFEGADRIEAQYAGMCVSFARNGDPNNEAFAETWHPYTADDHAVMRIDRTSSVSSDYDRELISILMKKYAKVFAENRLKRPSMVGV